MSVRFGVLIGFTMTLLLGCGSEQATPAETALGATQPSPTGKLLVNRSKALRDWTTLYGVELNDALFNRLPDLSITPVDAQGIAALPQLLPDLAYSVSVHLDKYGHQHIESLVILDPAAAHPVPLDEEDAASASKSDLRWALENADEDERTRILDSIELNRDGLAQLDNVLNHSDSEASRLDAVARLDLGEELGAKLLILDALQDPSDAVAVSALRSVERWQDQSTAPFVSPLSHHSNPEIAQIADDLLNSLSDLGNQVSESVSSTPVDLDRYQPNNLETDQLIQRHLQRAKELSPQ